MRKFFVLALCAIGLAGCLTYDNYYQLDSDYLNRRQIETMRFDTNDETAVLSASAQVLQDLGFTLEESETKLGLITGLRHLSFSTETALTGIACTQMAVGLATASV